MPGLATVVVSNPEEVTPTLDAMLSGMSHYPWLKAVRHREAGARVGLGGVTFASQETASLAAAADGSLVAYVDGGFFHDRAPGFSNRASDAEWLLGAWQAGRASGDRREEWLSELSGEFAAVVYDRTRGELSILTDRFGLRPVYVADAGGSFVAATEIKSVLAVPGVDTSWSDIGVSQFFSFGHFFGDDTLLRGVRAV